MPTSLNQRDSRAELRRCSKLLFGNADRLEVAVAVAASSSGVVFAQELADELGISPPRVRTQLLAFTEAEVMTKLPRYDRVQSYERRDHPFWQLALQVGESWDSRDQH